MNQDYWGIDDILVESQQIPCVFNIDVPGLGYLEGSEEEDVRGLFSHTDPQAHASRTAILDGSDACCI